MFKKILIANRGEIACRVINTCKIMGIKTVAVYSDADESALHADLADEAISIGGSSSSESYLVIEKIIAACKETKADAVHPGYGFLSENEQFAKALEENEIAFIGPNRKAIVSMGDKIKSKKIAEEANVNVIPGYTKAIKDEKEAVEIAKEIGYPVMLKASAGGGGKGMRVVRNDDECVDGFTRAKNESQASFGDDRIFAEKFITEPHHIEIQILADKKGDAIFLGERECSIQRRHQKVIEEAPSPFINDQTRQEMGRQAIALAKAVNYESAGTVEFIVDKDQNFYFLEMNTRLQVEHPVTEMVTGIDLVEQMIKIASGEKLKIKQSDIKTNGWAIESRVYAEDPYRDFMPSIGRLSKYLTPEDSDTVRVDTGIREGSEVSMFYDPMIAKLITHGENRDTAIENMTDAIDQYVIDGLSHNLNFLSSIMQNKTFRSGYTTTDFIEQEYPDGFQGEPVNEREYEFYASILSACYMLDQLKLNPFYENKNNYAIKFENKSIESTIKKDGDVFLVEINNNQYHLSLNMQSNDPRVICSVNDEKMIMQIRKKIPRYELIHKGKIALALISEQRLAALNELMPKKIPQDMSKFLLSPMPGLLIKVCVNQGQEVKAGEELAVVEAMKMENSLRASKDLKIKSILGSEGDNLSVDQKILEFED
ncbi:MAG: acetyl/propionyl-CoA carboxylase subunit alpha [Gammaproteobacteria bacterium]|nr:acetyl/propionyl-CoA carboxylase subunit alpha [Gammaproteobacteria bacterium]OUT95961.1 MAG: acetyl/propionyl-CoA carboxylase subunit alpha [Gammaproteobacteria bacterium TMED36]|tara:strand:+ start:6975 stop:8939 length:1965 start_codon:yes stop_codon:yes gene_type:complete